MNLKLQRLFLCFVLFFVITPLMSQDGIEEISISSGIAKSGTNDQVGGSYHIPIKITAWFKNNYGLSTGIEFWSMKVLDGTNTSRMANINFWDFGAYYGGKYWLLRLGGLLPIGTTVADFDQTIGPIGVYAGLYGNIRGERFIIEPFITFDLWASSLEFGSIDEVESAIIDLPAVRAGILLNFIIFNN